MKLYADSHDHTRFLEVLETKGKNYVCKVYFNEAKSGEDRRLSYAGKVTVTSSLFFEAPTNSWRDNSAFIAV
jgi:hypothetical protein